MGKKRTSSSSNAEWDSWNELVPGGQLFWAQLTRPSEVTSEGYPPDAPVIEFEKGPTIFSSAHGILQDLVGDVGEEVQIVHDPDHEQFPEVAAAVKQAGMELNCLCIGTCPSKGKWAIGLGNGWQSRERAVKISMAVAIAAGTEQMMQLANQYPEFAILCVSSGLMPPMALPAMAMKGFGKGFGKDPWGCGGGWGCDPFGKGFGKGAFGGKGPYGKGASGGPQQWAQESQEAGPGPKISWLSLDNNAKLVAEAGFPAHGPAVSHDKSHGEALRCANYILPELVGEVADNVQFTHDPDWEEFPEVAKALKPAGAEENCFAIASCPSQGKWGVGLGGGWKPRELACKFALCIAILAESDRFDSVCQQYPDFARYCATAGMIPSGGLPNKKRKVGQQDQAWGTANTWGGGGAAAAWSSPNKGWGKGGDVASAGGSGSSGGKWSKAKKLPNKPTVWPKDTPLWIELPAEKDMPAALKDLPRDALAVGTDGTQRKELYDSADAVLAQLMKGGETSIKYHDDNHWEQFPEVGDTLKAHDGDEDGTSGPRTAEEQLTVAVTASGNAWAVGFGAKWKSRNQAAKIALAVTLTLRAPEVPDLEAFPTFAEFIGEVQVQKSA